MKIITVIGTRAEVIRLSSVIRLLDSYSDHVLVNAGQSEDPRLSPLFFEDLGVREPDFDLGIKGEGFADQVGQIFAKSEQLLLEERPDRLLILGDANGGLTALIARRLGIPVYHMEAGTRCHLNRAPEEINRRVIDHASTILMPYTERNRENLLREGFSSDKIYVTGNPIKEVIDYYSDYISESSVLDDLGLDPDKYFLVTLHRPDYVDHPGRLRQLIDALGLLRVQYKLPVVCSLHPYLRSKIKDLGLDLECVGLQFIEPCGFFDFIRLEQDAFCMLSDSGPVQEEACILGVPNVTICDVTERPETLECGSNVIAGCDPERILQLVNMVVREERSWRPPTEYLANQVAETACRILTSFHQPDAGEAAWQERPYLQLRSRGYAV
ncbi:MAG TPA: UDP-N-acetylglucosamine 2-epimerase (non-hydrolyzing) [Blastocatellia bacterium]|nr:UDP-N-acetylglucosamine 2-epimerase (non-hydrolyzing) [Blastocatellia bacterium]